MAYELEELSLDLIDALVPLMPRIKQRDKNLEDQLRRAASSIGLNVAEAGGLGSGEQAGAVLYGGRERAGDAACLAAGDRLAACEREGGGAGVDVGAEDWGDPWEGDARVIVTGVEAALVLAVVLNVALRPQDLRLLAART